MIAFTNLISENCQNNQFCLCFIIRQVNCVLISHKYLFTLLKNHLQILFYFAVHEVILACNSPLYRHNHNYIKIKRVTYFSDIGVESRKKALFCKNEQIMKTKAQLWCNKATRNRRNTVWHVILVAYQTKCEGSLAFYWSLGVRCRQNHSWAFRANF